MTRTHQEGHTRAHTTPSNTWPPPRPQVRDVREPAIQRVAQHIQDNYTVGDQLKRELRQNILRLMDIKCYRGTRCARVYARVCAWKGEEWGQARLGAVQLPGSLQLPSPALQLTTLLRLVDGVDVARAGGLVMLP